MNTERMSSSDIQDVLLKTLRRPVQRALLTQEQHARLYKKLGMDQVDDKTTTPFDVIGVMLLGAAIFLGGTAPMLVMDYMASAKSFFSGLALSGLMAWGFFALAKRGVERWMVWFCGLMWLGPDDIRRLDMLGAKDAQLTTPIGAWLQVPRTVGEAAQVEALVSALNAARLRESAVTPSPAERWAQQVREHARSTTAAYERMLLTEAAGTPKAASAKARI